MIVYRYEDRDGLGPYYRYAVPAISDAHNATVRDPDTCQPAPVPDLGLAADRNGASFLMLRCKRFACPSLEAVNKWFKGWEIDLEKAGFQLTAYEVPDVAVELGKSGLQCVFDMRMARKVDL